MPSAFKKSIRGLLASVRSSVMDASDVGLDDAVTRILKHQYASGWENSAFSCLFKAQDGLALLHALQNDVRVYKASHYKQRSRLVFKDAAEHEFVILHLRHGRQDLLIRLDRSVGPTRIPKASFSNTNNTEKSPSPVSSSSSPPSSRASSSSSIGSIIYYPSLVVNYCVCRLSNISSHEHWARDTAVKIPKIPNNCYELKTIEYTGSSSSWPSLWDLVHIVEFVHEQCDNYDLIDAQCYWFADTITAMLENWSNDAKSTEHHGWKGIRSRVLSIPAPGTLKGFPIYKRDDAIIQAQKAGLTEHIAASTQLAVDRLDALNGGDLRVRRVEGQLQEAEKAKTSAREAQERAEAKAREAQERAEVKAREAQERAEVKAREAQERAEAKAREAQERAEAKAREAEERAEARAREAEERAERAERRANDVEAQLQVIRNAAQSDVLMARVVARLDEQSCHGLSVIV